MSSSSRIILIVLPVVALIAAVWLLVLSPQRERAAELETKASDLRSQVTQQEQLAATAETARKDFPRAYRRLVVLGKATPSDDDTSSLIVQLDRIAAEADVDFVSLEAEAGEAAAPTPAPTAPQTPADVAESSEQEVANVEAGQPATPAPATEASAALLPIGATIGPAGLPVMKYSLSFEGDFFRLADYLKGIDDLVTTSNDGHVGIQGRLITVDSFELEPVGEPGANPVLGAQFTITTFLTPADEGATGGASPTGPAPVTEAQPATAPPPATASETASTVTP